MEGCECIKNMVKRGWVEYRTPSVNPNGDRKYFIIVTNKKREDGDGLVGIILQRCFICGEDIYPK